MGSSGMDDQIQERGWWMYSQMVWGCQREIWFAYLNYFVSSLLTDASFVGANTKYSAVGEPPRQREELFNVWPRFSVTVRLLLRGNVHTQVGSNWFSSCRYGFGILLICSNIRILRPNNFQLLSLTLLYLTSLILKKSKVILDKLFFTATIAE